MPAGRSFFIEKVLTSTSLSYDLLRHHTPLRNPQTLVPNSLDMSGNNPTNFQTSKALLNFEKQPIFSTCIPNITTCDLPSLPTSIPKHFIKTQRIQITGQGKVYLDFSRPLVLRKEALLPYILMLSSTYPLSLACLLPYPRGRCRFTFTYPQYQL